MNLVCLQRGRLGNVDLVRVLPQTGLEEALQGLGEEAIRGRVSLGGVSDLEVNPLDLDLQFRESEEVWLESKSETATTEKERTYQE